MGGRGSSAGGAGGAGGGLFAATPNANGGVTITPNGGGNVTPPLNAQALAAGGTGGSDVKTHTTYFTPADYAIVSGGVVTDGYRMSPRSGTMQVVGYYNTGDYYNINTELRELSEGKRRSLTPKTQKVVDAMDRNMRPLNAPIDTVRWTDGKAIAANLGMKGATKQEIINRLAQADAVKSKSDYTSSSWDAKQNAVAGTAGRDVRLDMHYAKGAMAQFSPTRKEGEMVGARNAPQRYANARFERTLVYNARSKRQYYDNILVVDVYVDQ